MGEGFSVDLALVRGETLGPDAYGQVEKVLQILAPRGAVVYTCDSSDLLSLVWNKLREYHPSLTYVRGKDGRTGCILRADEGRTVAEYTAEWPTQKVWVWLYLAGRDICRAVRAIGQPSMYGRYAARLLSCLRATPSG